MPNVRIYNFIYKNNNNKSYVDKKKNYIKLNFHVHYTGYQLVQRIIHFLILFL